MIIVLESIANGNKLKIEKLESNQWIDENGVQLSNEQHIKILENAEIGTEIGGLLYESRFQIIEVKN